MASGGDSIHPLDRDHCTLTIQVHRRSWAATHGSAHDGWSLDGDEVKVEVAGHLPPQHAVPVRLVERDAPLVEPGCTHTHADTTTTPRSSHA
jgi:endonuclease YncB( thermonuclease family)